MLKTLKTKLSSFIANTQGGLSPIFAVSLVGLLGAGGLALDVQNIQKTKEKLQAITDAAALGIAKEQLSNEADMRRLAEGYIASHPELGNITIDRVSRNGDTYGVVLSTVKPTYLMHLFGNDQVTVRTDSETTYQIRQFNLALVLDTTGSMNNIGPDGVRKIDSLKVAATDLVNEIESTAGGSARISIVPFAQYVNVGTQNRNAPWIEFNSQQERNNWNGCVGSLPAPMHLNAAVAGRRIPGLTNGVDCGTSIQPLTNNASALRSKISALTPVGWTYIPDGISWGWRALSASAPMAEAATTPTAEKYMVIMTDGANTTFKNGLRHDIYNGGQASPQTNALTAQMCRRVKDDNIQVYTIAFAVNDATTRNLLRECASDPSMYFDASNSAELSDAFSNITIRLLDLRLTN